MNNFNSFVKSLATMRKQLIKNKLDIDRLIELKPLFGAYANTVLMQDRNGTGISKDILDSLEDFLMLCMDVYTYSSNGDVLIPDYQYDQVMHVFTTVLKREKMVYSDYIESRTTWPFVKHEAPFMVGTINRKVYDPEDLGQFLRTRWREGYRKIKYAPKIDGISTALSLRNGQIELAVTRNNGLEGQDITEVIRRMNRYKRIFTPDMPDGYYKCEIAVSTDDYNELVQEKKYANRRSAAAAIISTPSNLHLAQYITAIPLAWVNFEGTRMRYLADAYLPKGITLDTSDFHLDVVYENIEKILNIIRRPEFPYRVDGVVLFPVHLEDEEPNTTDLMASSMAYKVNTQEAVSQVEFVYPSIGRTGLMKPMARIKPAEVNETIVTDVSIGSMAIFSTRCIHEGEDVIVFSAGDVIPQIRMPDERNYPKGAKILKLDLTCPYCGKRLRPKTENGAELYCLNPRCLRVMSGRLAGFLEKLDVAEGFRDETMFSLCEAGLLNGIEDLFSLQTKINRVYEVIGPINGDKLIEGLKQLRTKTFEISEVIGALGIEDIAQKTCQTIFRDVTLPYLLDYKRSKIEALLLDIPGIGMTTAKRMAGWIDDNREFIEFLYANMKLVNDPIAYGNVCFTGFRNKDYADIFKSIGFPTHQGITKDTVAVVYAGDAESTTNGRNALKKGLPMVHVKDIDELVDYLTRESKRLENSELVYSAKNTTKGIFQGVTTLE